MYKSSLLSWSRIIALELTAVESYESSGGGERGNGEIAGVVLSYFYVLFLQVVRALRAPRRCTDSKLLARVYCCRGTCIATTATEDAVVARRIETTLYHNLELKRLLTCSH